VHGKIEKTTIFHLTVTRSRGVGIGKLAGLNREKSDVSARKVETAVDRVRRIINKVNKRN